MGLWVACYFGVLGHRKDKRNFGKCSLRDAETSASCWYETIKWITKKTPVTFSSCGPCCLPPRASCMDTVTDQADRTRKWLYGPRYRQDWDGPSTEISSKSYLKLCGEQVPGVPEPRSLHNIQRHFCLILEQIWSYPVGAYYSVLSCWLRKSGHFEASANVQAKANISLETCAARISNGPTITSIFGSWLKKTQLSLVVFCNGLLTWGGSRLCFFPNGFVRRISTDLHEQLTAFPSQPFTPRVHGENCEKGVFRVSVNP